MSSSIEVDPTEAARGLFLILPPQSEVDLVPVLASGTIIGVLLGPGPGETSGGRSEVRAVCRSAGVALFADDLDEAERLDADGVVLEATAVGRARQKLGSGRLIGAQAGISRHQAMVAGEEGADFIAFGGLDHPPSERLIEIVAWWSELFVLPSLALARDVDEAAAARLAEAGADFLGVSLASLSPAPAVVGRLASAFGIPPPG